LQGPPYGNLSADLDAFLAGRCVEPVLGFLPGFRSCRANQLDALLRTQLNSLDHLWNVGLRPARGPA